MPGLRGLIGVDFVWEPGARDATILEINPRPTTSVVGLCRILPPGRLAQSWLAACGVPGYPRDLPWELSATVSRHPGISFDARGTTQPLKEESSIL